MNSTATIATPEKMNEYDYRDALDEKNNLKKIIEAVVPKPMSKAAFQRLPQWKRRVMIAEDALALLRTQLIQSTTGTYVDNWETGNTNESATSLEGMCQLFAGGSCQVCAKGALFVSTVMRTNKMKVGEVLHQDTNVKVCDKENVFDHETFNLIEAAFENSDSFYIEELLENLSEEDADLNKYESEAYERFNEVLEGSSNARGPLSKKMFNCAVLARQAVKFGSRYEDDTERLAAILINIIRNKGKFIPHKIVSVRDIKKELKNPFVKN